MQAFLPFKLGSQFCLFALPNFADVVVEDHERWPLFENFEQTDVFCGHTDNKLCTAHLKVKFCILQQKNIHLNR